MTNIPTSICSVAPGLQVRRKCTRFPVRVFLRLDFWGICRSSGAPMGLFPATREGCFSWLRYRNWGKAIILEPFKKGDAYVEILCPAVGLFCGTDGHLCQNRREGCQFGSGHGHPDECHSAHYVGHRAVRTSALGGEDDRRTYLAVPDLVWCGYRSLLAFLFQGVADGRRVARGADRQVERGDNHLPVVSVSEGAGHSAGYPGRPVYYLRQYHHAGQVSRPHADDACVAVCGAPMC